MFFKHRSICLECGHSYPGKKECFDKCLVCHSTNMINVSKKDGKRLWRIRWIKDDDKRWNALKDYTKNVMHIDFPVDIRKYTEECVQRNRTEADRIARESRVMSFTPSTSITCPYCHSTNVSKISTLDRGISVGMTGLASGKLGKQWHCNKCKSNF